MDYEVGSSEILFDNHTSIKLPFPLKKAQQFKDMLIVLVDDGLGRKFGDDSLNRNIIAFSKKGDQSWLIEPAPHGAKNQPKPYLDIVIRDDQLYAYNWIGIKYHVDYRNGGVNPAPNVKERPW